MLTNFLKGKTSILNDEIGRVYREMNTFKTDSEEYSASLGNLERLIKLQKEYKGNKISPDTIMIVCGNLLGILIIVGYEHGHVIISRGLGFILKTKHQ